MITQLFHGANTSRYYDDKKYCKVYNQYNLESFLTQILYVRGFGSVLYRYLILCIYFGTFISRPWDRILPFLQLNPKEKKVNLNVTLSRISIYYLTLNQSIILLSEGSYGGFVYPVRTAIYSSKPHFQSFWCYQETQYFPCISFKGFPLLLH